MVLARDGFRCQVVTNGIPCGQVATVAGHITPRTLWPEGMPGVDHGANLRAECRRCSNSGGTALRHDLERRGRADIRRQAERGQWSSPVTTPMPPASPVNDGFPVRPAVARLPTAPVRDVPIEEEPGVF
jgi:hypothetical protein